MSAAVVAHNVPVLLRHLALEAPQSRLERSVGHRRPCQGGVQPVHVCLVVAIVMQVHRVGVDDRLQRVIAVRQGRHLTGHVVSFSSRDDLILPSSCL
jgi:hypothetical protein